MHFIGYNGYGEFGLDHKETLKKFTSCPNKEIAKVFSGNVYSIYTDDNYDNLWSAGYNARGSCGIGSNKDRLLGLESIKHIFVINTGYGSFFISEDNKLYGCGRNTGSQLGVKTKAVSQFGDEDIYTPQLIDNLANIIDIKSCELYSIAICSDNNPNFMVIIANLSRLHSLPQDIMSMVVLYCKSSKVYATTKEGGTGHLQDIELKDEYGWNEVDAFKDVNIIKIAVGQYHSLFLEESGVLWTCGYYKYGRLGLGIKESEYQDLKHFNGGDLYQVTKIPLFVKEKIIINDIKCGGQHNLALDINGKVYSWGSDN